MMLSKTDIDSERWDRRLSSFGPTHSSGSASHGGQDGRALSERKSQLPPFRAMALRVGKEGQARRMSGKLAWPHQSHGWARARGP
jgi:hypothetical protein